MKTLATIIETARHLHAEAEAVGGKPTPSAASPLLEMSEADARLSSVLSTLGEEALTEVLALVWVARGDYSGDSWAEALEGARRASNARLATYLASTEGLADLLENGLAELNAASD